MHALAPEEEIVLLAAGTALRRNAARERYQQLVPALDWVRLAGMLRHGRLLPTLGPRILELSGERAPDSFASSVEQATASTRRQDALLQLVCARVMAALADAGIRSTPLKGSLLGEAIYGEPGRRHSSDIDLLVATEQLRAAVEVVRELGYAAPRDHVEDGLPSLHFALAHARGELPPVELHWRIHWYERDFARERLLPPSTAAAERAWRTTPVDEFAALLLFYARDGFIGLRLASDLSAWWDAFGDRVSREDLDALLGAHPALARAVLAAIAAAQRVVGLPASEIAVEPAQLPLRARIAVAMVSPFPRTSRPQLYADMGMVDWLLAPPGGVCAAVRRQLLVPKEVRVQRARRAGGRVPSVAGHSARVVGRYGLTMARLARH